MRRRLALLLLSIALFAQIGAPLAGVAARAAEHVGMSAAFCDILRSGHTSADPNSAPASQHEHASGCAQCPAAQGAAPLTPTIATIAERIPAYVFRPPAREASAHVFAKVLNQGAPPRAPPSRA